MKASLAWVTVYFVVHASSVNAHGCHEQFLPLAKGVDVYKVVEGDTLWSISIGFSKPGDSWRILKDANPRVCDADLIYPGNELSIPDKWRLRPSLVDDCPKSTSQDSGSSASPGQEYSAPGGPGCESNKEDHQGDVVLIQPQMGLDDKLKAIAAGKSDPLLDPTAELAQLKLSEGREVLAGTMAKAFPTDDAIRAYFEFEETYGNRITLLGSPYAEQRSPDVVAQKNNQKTIAVLFSNGVGNLNSDAYNSILALRDAIRERDETAAESIQFGYTHNVTKGIANDIREAFFQLAGEDKLEGWQLMINGSSDGGEAKADFISRLANLLTEKPAPQLFDDYERQIADYKKAVREISCGVVVVAHSQGNLFAAWIYNKLDKEDRSHVRVISVASPAPSVVHEGSSFFTNGPNKNDKSLARFLRGDKVIGVLEGWAPTKQNVLHPLPREVEHLTDEDDILGHGFVEAYIGRGDPTREKLIDAVLNEVELLRNRAVDSCQVRSTVPIDKADGPFIQENLGKYLLVACGLLMLLLAYISLRRRFSASRADPA